MVDVKGAPASKARKAQMFVLFIIVFAFGYFLLAHVTKWTGVFWLVPGNTNSGARALRPSIAGIIVAAPVSSLLVGLLWRRTTAWRWFGDVSVVRTIVVAAVVTAISYGPLLLLAPVLSENRVGLRDEDFVVTLGHIWYVVGPAVATALTVGLFGWRAQVRQLRM